MLGQGRHYKYRSRVRGHLLTLTKDKLEEMLGQGRLYKYHRGVQVILSVDSKVCLDRVFLLIRLEEINLDKAQGLIGVTLLWMRWLMP